MKINNMAQYNKDRDEAYFSLDKNKILDFCRKYKIKPPESDEILFVAVHKSILYLNSATEKQREYSREWLISHGYNDYITAWGKNL